jgi:hypothetical protein
MKKILQITITILLGYTLTNCVDDSIDLNKLNKDIVFSQDHGISIQIGTMDTVSIGEYPKKGQPELPPGIYVEIETEPVEVNGIFTNELYDYFIIKQNGQDQPLGDITLEADFYSGIKDAKNKIKDDHIFLVAEIRDKNGKPIEINIPKQTFIASLTTPQDFIVKIPKDDVPKLKNADGLFFQYSLEGNKSESSDYILMNNVTITLAGGVKISLD